MDMRKFIELNGSNTKARQIAWDLASIIPASMLAAKLNGATERDFAIGLMFVTESLLRDDVSREELRGLLIASNSENTAILKELNAI